MDDSTYQKIAQNPSFRELIRKRGRFASCLALIMLFLYFSFIFLIAFEPDWLGTPISVGSSVTRGIPIGIGLIVISFILTGVYVVRANSEFDRLNNKILSEVES